MTDLMDDTLARVKEIVRDMCAQEFPGKQMELDDELLRLGIIQHIAIRAALGETVENDDVHRDQ